MAAELKIGIGADNSGLSKGLRDAEAQITAFVSKVNKIAQVGEQLSSIGQKMTVGLTLPIAGLAAGALNAFKELEGVRVAFNRLNDPTLLDELRKATKNTTSDLQLMQSAVSAEKFGLSVSALPKLLEYARRVAKDTGQSVDYLVDSIVTGIGRKSPLILDNLGISATDLKEALGGVTMEAASVGQVTEAVAKIAQRELQKMGADTNTLAESWAQVRTSVSNSLARIGEVINKNLDISGVIDKLTGFIDKVVSAFENLSPAIQKTILVVTGLVAAAGPLLVVVGGIMSALPTIIAGLGAFKVALVALTGPIGLVTAGLVGIAVAVTSNWGKIKPYVDGVRKWLNDIYKDSLLVRLAVESISAVFKTNFSVVGTVLSAAWEVIKSFVKATADSFAGLGTVLKGVLTLDPEAIKTGLGQVAIAMNMGVVNIMADVKTGLNNAFADINRIFKDGFANVMQIKPSGTGGVSDEIAKEVEKEITKGVTKGKANAKSKNSIQLEDVVTLDLKPVGLMNEFGEVFDSLAGFETRQREISQRIANNAKIIPIAFEESTTKLQEITKDFNEALTGLINQSLTNTIADSFASLGQAIASGENGFAAAGKSLLSSFGGFMQDLGKMAIAWGVKALAIQTALKSFNPYIAIAAGAALVAIGSAFSSAMSSMSASYGSTGSYSTSAGANTGGGSSNYSNYSTYSSGGGSEVVFRISGNDLIGVLQRAGADLERLKA